MRRSILIEKLFICVCTCDVQTQSGLILMLHVILSSDELALVPRAAHCGGAQKDLSPSAQFGLAAGHPTSGHGTTARASLV